MVNTNESWYQYPNATDSVDAYEFLGFVNRTASGMFMPVMLLVIWVVSFVGVFGAMGSSRAAAARAFTFSSFICSILAIMLSIMGFLAARYMYILFFMLGVGILWLRLETPSLE